MFMKNSNQRYGLKSFFIVIAASCLIFSCKKIQQLLTFDISNESSVTIDSSTPVNLPFDVSSPNVTTNSSQQFQNNNSNINLVKDIRLESLQMSITSPSGQTFAFLQSIHIYISTDSSNEIELASLDSIPASMTSIVLTPTQAKLDQYVKASSYNLRTEAVARQVLTQNVNININSKFKVTANL
jgi:hypothetical protein